MKIGPMPTSIRYYARSQSYELTQCRVADLVWRLVTDTVRGPTTRGFRLWVANPVRSRIIGRTT